MSAMISSVLVLAVLGADCVVPAKVTLAMKEGAELQSLVAWYARTSCKSVTIDDDVKKDTPIKVGLSGTVSWLDAESLVRTALRASGLTFSTRRAGLVVTRPLQEDAAPPIDADACRVLASAIQIVSATERTVTRAAFDGNWSGCALTQARVVPAFQNGETNGYKVFSIRPESVWAAAGFLNGDVVRTLNSAPLGYPDELDTAVKKLRASERLEFGITRRGEAMVLIITVSK